MIGSYGKKTYNHSCDELYSSMNNGEVNDRFLRTCPVGVKSCFGAMGFYDHEDSDPTNDLSECKGFLGPDMTARIKREDLQPCGLFWVLLHCCCTFLCVCFCYNKYST